MADTNTPPSRRSGVATASLVAASFVAVAVFVSCPVTESFELAALGVLWSCWAALPLFLLGVIKLFRTFPTTHGLLLALGVFASVVAVASSNGLGLLVIPFYLHVIYGVASFVLLCRKDRMT
jgi:hypothetical protein